MNLLRIPEPVSAGPFLSYKCHLYMDIRRHLLGVGDFAELRPRQFYEQLED